MAGHIWIKVVGFTDTERHSLNTLFRLSSGNPTSYALWSEHVAHPPQVAIVDFDSYEAGLQTSLPSFNANLKVIGVGAKVSDNAWRTFTRPVDWGGLVRTLGELFSPHLDNNCPADVSLDTTMPLQTSMAPGLKVALMVSLSPFDCFYMRARLALAGVAEADVAESLFVAQALRQQRSYDLIVVCLDVLEGDPWDCVKTLRMDAPTGQSVIVACSNPTVQSIEQADQLGCLGLLEMPFSPGQVQSLLQKV